MSNSQQYSIFTESTYSTNQTQPENLTQTRIYEIQKGFMSCKYGAFKIWAIYVRIKIPVYLFFKRVCLKPVCKFSLKFSYSSTVFGDLISTN